MKTHKIALILVCSLFTHKALISQTIIADTTLANVYYEKAIETSNAYKFDSAVFYLENAKDLYTQHLGEVCLKNAKVLDLTGRIYYWENQYNSALECYTKALKIKNEILGENHTEIAVSYNNLGSVHRVMNHFDLALEYQMKSLLLNRSLLGENSNPVANNYYNLACICYEKSENDLGLEYLFKSLKIRKELMGETNLYVANNYVIIGMLYDNKYQCDLALEYYFKALQIQKDILGPIHSYVSATYNNIGVSYNNKREYDLALDYFFKSLEIDKSLYDEKHFAIANTYNNIGSLYMDKNDFNTALDYHFKALSIRKELFGEMHSDVAVNYNNIGLDYHHLNQYDSAFKYYFKSLQIIQKINGNKHYFCSILYNNIGNTCIEMALNDSTKYKDALYYYHKGMVSSLLDYNDTTNVYTIPAMHNFHEFTYLIKNLMGKATVFMKYPEYKNLALLCFQACDSIIIQVRKEITSQSDKIALGENANLVYQNAADLCSNMIIENLNSSEINKYSELAFYFSERNKSSVLLEALAGSEALKFAGIPDSVVERENNLKISISNLINLKNNAENDSITSVWSNLLFRENRSYDSLINILESHYPEYYQLKYNNKPTSVREIQNILDKKTAMLSYSILDSSIMIHALTKNRFETFSIPKIENFDGKLIEFRSVMQTSSPEAILKYKNLGFELYKQLFPSDLTESKFFSNVKTLIIIPDGNLATLPFESMLTDKYNAEWTDWTNFSYFSDMPFLIKKYAVSYSYSATLCYNTFLKTKTETPEFTDLKDWMAFAPVFDNDGISGTTSVTRKLLTEIQTDDFSNPGRKRALLRDGTYISPLPGSMDEVNEIFRLFDQTGRKAVIYTHKKADESILKSDEPQNYRILHFATHGFVNTENPELSGILTAQDTSASFTDNEDIYGYIAQQNDGIWYQSEIYNTKLNADLVVLSACETGLGKIASGEGVIGLTRALLYAGTKNIIVSLWQVSDQSTKQLMVEFYKNLLSKNAKPKTDYAQHLRKAKLSLIKEGTYAHPFFWSPFILIGK